MHLADVLRLLALSTIEAVVRQNELQFILFFFNLEVLFYTFQLWWQIGKIGNFIYQIGLLLKYELYFIIILTYLS